MKNENTHQTIKDIYEEYRDDMAGILALEDERPDLFTDPAFLERFTRAIDRLDTLIDLYGALLTHNRLR